MSFEVDYEAGRIDAFGSVGLSDWEDGFAAGDFAKAFRQFGGRDIEIRLQSPGGDVQAGLSLYNQISDYGGKITVIIDALAASIASVFPLAADDVLAFPNSRLMVHNPWTIAVGDARAFRHTADILEALGEDIADTYAEHSGQDRDFWLDKMDEETYFSAAEALEVGLITGIYNAKATARDPAPVAVRPKLAYLEATRQRLALARQRLGF